MIFLYSCSTIHLSIYYTILLNFYILQGDFEHYGIDWESPVPAESENFDVDAVNVPETACPLSREHVDELARTVDPLRNSDSYGIDIYMETVEYVNAHTV